ncbi:ABC transporter permease [Clostridium kluyveri]|uniref:Bacitracin ABC transporter permease n=1 Tax=Clostridium kluyveri TaxID=1534 RepID=A0A1L5FA55_CLOKL|nr:ABC transporter permease [Clostridium kluyveri]APM39898.1 bacitracin ABC transporter permease [Clostridium kluyveri]UZQ49896.1 ABC transporter permease [Clostridium kluyveri]
MLKIISCELLKLKRSKIIPISIAGVLSTPLLMLLEALQTYFDKPELVFTLSDVYNSSVLYTMLLTNMMVYIAIAAFLFSREYTENTLKTILPIPISRTKLLLGKFCTLLLEIVTLNIVTWAGIFIVCGIYHAIFTMEGYSLLVAIEWFPKFLLGGILMFLTTSPFVFVAGKTKGFVAPMIGSAVIVMGSAALANQEWGAIYPWTATFFLVQGKIENTGYPIALSVGIILLLSAVGFFMTYHHFEKEDLR